MPFLIDARLECSRPSIRILDTETGRSLCEWGQQVIEQWKEAGEICLLDFASSDERVLRQLMKDLFLFSCMQDIEYATSMWQGHCSGCGRCSNKSAQVVPIFPGGRRH
jgi:hypothetical protein